MLCLVTCLDKLIEVDIQKDVTRTLLNYRDRFRSDTTRKASFPSYAQYTGFDDLILLCVQGYLCLVNQNGEILNERLLKFSPLFQQRICINREDRTCILARRSELLTISLPSMETISSYRDSVNDSPWKCVESLPSQKLVMAMPENYVLDGPVFFIMPPENNVDVVVYREPKQRMAWGLLHPSGNSILFCTDQRELLLYRNEDRTIHWNVSKIARKRLLSRVPCIPIISRTSRRTSRDRPRWSLRSKRTISRSVIAALSSCSVRSWVQSGNRKETRIRMEHRGRKGIKGLLVSINPANFTQSTCSATVQRNRKFSTCIS